MGDGQWTHLAEPWRCVKTDCTAMLRSGSRVYKLDNGSTFCEEHGESYLVGEAIAQTREAIAVGLDDPSFDEKIGAAEATIAEIGGPIITGVDDAVPVTLSRACIICDGVIANTLPRTHVTCTKECYRVLKKRNRPSADFGDDSGTRRL